MTAFWVTRCERRGDGEWRFAGACFDEHGGLGEDGLGYEGSILLFSDSWRIVEDVMILGVYSPHGGGAGWALYGCEAPREPFFLTTDLEVRKKLDVKVKIDIDADALAYFSTIRPGWICPLRGDGWMGVYVPSSQVTRGFLTAFAHADFDSSRLHGDVYVSELDLLLGFIELLG